MSDVQIIVPAGMFGANEFDSALDTFLRQVAKTCSKDKGEWAEKYGTNIENDIFLMHRYCWCDKDDCAWCGGCECPEESFTYFVDGVHVSYKEYQDFYDIETYVKVTNGKVKSLFEWFEGQCHKDAELDAKHNAAAEEANRRRTSKHDPVCDFCLGKGVFERFGGAGKTNGHGAPNFWYKPLDFRVNWYKYIGRSTEVNKQLTTEEFEQMRFNCLMRSTLENLI